MRLPFSDVYLSLKDLYRQQYLRMFEGRQEITCYRGCQMSEEEIKFFAENTGEYIQMEGFLSTSLWRAVGENFINNTFLKIRVEESERQYADHGFADISEDSLYKREK